MKWSLVFHRPDRNGYESHCVRGFNDRISECISTKFTPLPRYLTTNEWIDILRNQCKWAVSINGTVNTPYIDQ